MTPLCDLAARLQRTVPEAKIDVSEPAAVGGVGFLDISQSGNVIAVQWHEKWHFGLSSRREHGYGEKPDEVYRTVEAAAARIAELLSTNKKTEQPADVAVREQHAATIVAQTPLPKL